MSFAIGSTITLMTMTAAGVTWRQYLPRDGIQWLRMKPLACRIRWCTADHLGWPPWSSNQIKTTSKSCFELQFLMYYSYVYFLHNGSDISRIDPSLFHSQHFQPARFFNIRVILPWWNTNKFWSDHANTMWWPKMQPSKKLYVSALFDWYLLLSLVFRSLLSVNIIYGETGWHKLIMQNRPTMKFKCTPFQLNGHYLLICQQSFKAIPP